MPEWNMSAVTSFDVGLRTLSECSATMHEGVLNVQHWSLDDIVAPHSKAAIKRLTNEQVARWTLCWLQNCSDRYDALYEAYDGRYRIVIESQPPKGTAKLKAVQFILFGFFGTRYPRAKVQFASPRLKLRYDPSGGTQVFPSSGTYKLNKAQAIEKAEYVVQHLPMKTLCLRTWRSAKKKDDLADALLQALQSIGATLSPSS